jgi:hypothetical protein
MTWGSHHGVVGVGMGWPLEMPRARVSARVGRNAGIVRVSDRVKLSETE